MSYLPSEKEQKAAERYLLILGSVVAEFEKDYPWISVPLLLAIVSRETWWGQAPGYVPKGNPSGAGDAGHGHGFFQIDDRAHPAMVRSGQWAEVGPAARYAIKNVLVPAYAYLKKQFPKLSGPELIRAAIASYNCGAKNVKKALARGEVDKYTAGGDYSRDVLKREQWWQNWYQEKMKGAQKENGENRQMGGMGNGE